MARFVLKKPFFSLGGEDMSADVSQVMLTKGHTAVTQSITAGNDWAENTPSGKGMWSMAVTFEVDGYDAANVMGHLHTFFQEPIGSASVASQPVVVRPDAGTVSTSNPQEAGNAVLQSIEPLGSGQVGSVVTFTLNLVGDGALTRTTS